MKLASALVTESAKSQFRANPAKAGRTCSLLQRYGATRGRTVECTQAVVWEYPVCSYRTLRRRAAVALMTGCEALRTTYRIGFEWRQENPSGSPPRLTLMCQNHRRRTGVFPADTPSPRRVVAAHPATVYGDTEGVWFLSFQRRSPPNRATHVPVSDVSRLRARVG